MQVRIVALALAGAAVLAGCATTRAHGESGGKLEVAASINAWGSILAQLGGTHVHAVSIIANPATDPHSYEPTPADARTIAESTLFVENGVGYDSWAAKSLAASPDSTRRVINVGSLVHVDAGGNPHRWYDPADVAAVADAITSALQALDPPDAAYFAQRHTSFVTAALGGYRHLIASISSRYAGTPVGASESIFAPMADALHLALVTPAPFLKAISEGTDPSPADNATIDRQISSRAIKVYVYNSQNSTPDVAAQVAACRRHSIPVVAVTETLSPAGATFQQWQAGELNDLSAALHRATGR